jgi:hypothetical protein
MRTSLLYLGDRVLRRQNNGLEKIFPPIRVGWPYCETFNKESPHRRNTAGTKSCLIFRGRTGEISFPVSAINRDVIPFGVL